MAESVREAVTAELVRLGATPFAGPDDEEVPDVLELADLSMEVGDADEPWIGATISVCRGRPHRAHTMDVEAMVSVWMDVLIPPDDDPSTSDAVVEALTVAGWLATEVDEALDVPARWR